MFWPQQIVGYHLLIMDSGHLDRAYGHHHNAGAGGESGICWQLYRLPIKITHY